MKDKCIEVALADALEAFEKRYNININYEWSYNSNPIKDVLKAFDKIGFGKGNKEDDLSKDRTVIKIVCDILDDGDWCYMKPKFFPKIYSCEFDNYLMEKIREGNQDNDTGHIQQLMEQFSTLGEKFSRKSPFWIWRDGANWDLWVMTHEQMVKEVRYWFSDCLYEENERDRNDALEILYKLNKTFCL